MLRQPPAFRLELPRSPATPLLLAVVAGLLLAVLGPFGSYLNAGPARRAAYWVGATLLGLALYGTAFRTVARHVPRRSRAWWPALVGGALLASVPEAVATRAAAFRLWPELAGLGLPWTLWFAQTATIGLVATAGAVLLRGPSRPVSPGPVASPAATTPATPLGADVLALQMEDHYVRVHRPSGSSLVLMPLGRAVDGMTRDGLRTHRSWWVATHAVARVEGDARAMRLHLSNGLVAPVARSAVARLREAGWLAGTCDDRPA